MSLSPHDVYKALSAPFASVDIEWRVQQSGVKNNRPWAMVLAYITNRAIQNRLDEVFGPMGWRNEYREEAGGVMCGISVWNSEQKEWVTKWDGAEKTDVESFKGGLSASMKRAAVQWGIGRYLYKLESGFAQCFNDKQGKNRGTASDKQTRQKTYFTWNPPALPAWALPDDEQQQIHQQQNHQPHQIHQPQQQVADHQPQQQIVQQTAKSTVEQVNGQYIVRDTPLGQVANRQNQQNKVELQKQLYQQQNPLNEAQQAANALVEQHIQRSNEESQKYQERQEVIAATGQAEQSKINEMAGYPVITPHQMRQLKNVLGQARFSEQGFCQKVGIKRLGMFQADRFNGAITWLQKMASSEQERLHRST